MSKLKDVAKTLYYRSKQELGHGGASSSNEATEQERSIIASLKWNGYAVLPGFYDVEKCAQLRREMDEVFARYDAVLWKDPADSDHRAYAAETVSEMIREYHDEPLVKRVARRYLDETQENFFTLANKVTPKPGNLGSGQGWHRDTPHERQFKSLLYVSDVGEGNGAFEYVPGSHRLRFFVSTIMRADVRHGQARFTDEEVQSIVDQTRSAPVKFLAPAGTMLIIDSSGIHRGSPIETGVRYALTNYYYDRASIELLKAAGKFTGYFVNRQPRQA